MKHIPGRMLSPMPASRPIPKQHYPSCESGEELKIMDCLKWIFPTQSSSKLIFHAKIRSTIPTTTLAVGLLSITSSGNDSRSGNGIPIGEEVWLEICSLRSLSLQSIFHWIKKEDSALWLNLLSNFSLVGGNINTFVFDNFSRGPARNRTIDGATIDGDPKEIHWKGNSIPIC